MKIFTITLLTTMIFAANIFAQENFICGETFTDPRDGQTYNTVHIDGQCWLKENLNIGEMINGTEEMIDNSIIEKYCYDDNTSNCDTYGGLYQWNEIMHYVTDTAIQGICPEGWYLPTDYEWKILEGTVDSQYPVGDPIWNNTSWRGFDAGLNLKSTSGWSSGNGNDLYGFTALPSGYRQTNGSFDYLIGYTHFWTSSEASSSSVWLRSLNVSNGVHRGDYPKGFGFSVRCLKDETIPQEKTVTTEANPLEGGTTSGDGSYLEGTVLTVYAYPNADWSFIDWTVDGVEVSVTAEFTFTLVDDIHLVANFEPIPQEYTVTLEVDPVEGGTVEGGGTFEENTEITVTATPNEGWQFVNWTDEGVEVFVDHEYTFIVVEDILLIANFVPFSIHFPFESGNPADPVWTIYLAAGTFDELDLQIMDEIAIFDGETIVGGFTLTEVLTPEYQFDNILIAWSTLYSGENGYIPGNAFSLKCWDASEGIEASNFDITFYDPYGDAYVGDVFPDGDGQYSIVGIDFVTTITQFYSLQDGYQFVSSRVIPEDQNMQNICNDILDNLDFVRNSAGYMLRKIGPMWVNGIGDWITTEGYLFRMNDIDVFEIEGFEIDPQTPISLTDGYQFISYLPENPLDAQVVFTDVLDNLDFVRNSTGYMLRKIGPMWVNGIGDLIPCEGYLVRMNAPDVLIYPESDMKYQGLANLESEYFKFDGGNPADPVYTIYPQGLDIGDEVAAYDGDVMIGAVKINSMDALDNELPIFSTITEGKGYKSGNQVKLKVWDNKLNKEVNVSFEYINPYGTAYTENYYPNTDGEYSIVKLTKINNNDLVNNINIFPNPANDVINIVSDVIMIKIELINMSGQSINTKIERLKTCKFDIKDLVPGVYFIKIHTDKNILVEKVTIN